MVPSQLAEASVLPSGANATLVTEPVWPLSTTGAALGAASDHRRMVWSPLAEASVLPSGANATLVTPESWLPSPRPAVRPRRSYKVVRLEGIGGVIRRAASTASSKARCGYWGNAWLIL